MSARPQTASASSAGHSHVRILALEVLCERLVQLAARRAAAQRRERSVLGYFPRRIQKTRPRGARQRAANADAAYAQLANR